MWFENWDTIGQIIIKGVVCFIGLILLLRLGGKRTLTKMNAFDFIMTFTIGSTLASIITSNGTTITEGMTALGIIILMQFIIAWLEVRFDWFQKIIKSRPTVLFYDGRFREEAMRNERITKVEVLAAMRYNGLADPSEAELVLIETDGQLSVIPKKEEPTNYGVMQSVESFDPKGKSFPASDIRTDYEHAQQ